MQVGSLVTIAPPWDAQYPDTYPILFLFDSAAIVMVPGWVQEGDTLDTSIQGPNFDLTFLLDTGQVVDISTLDIPKNITPVVVDAVPDQITLLQLKKCLVQNNLFDTVNAQIQAMPQSSDAFLGWNYGAVVNKNSPLLAMLTTQFNLTKQFDSLWLQASKIDI